MALRDCLYELENHPDLHDQFKRDLADGRVDDVPRYLAKLVEDLNSEKMIVQQSAVKLKQAIAYIDKYVVGAPHKRAHGRALKHLIANDYKAGRTQANVLSMEGRAEAINGLFQSRIADMMHEYRPRKFGFDRSIEAQEQLLHAFYGTSNDVDALRYQQILSNTLEEARLWFNSLGGNIEKLETYRVPQPSDPIKVGSVGKKEWKEFVWELLDPDEKIRQARSVLDLPDGATMTEKQLDTAFDKVYTNIVTRGAASIEPSGNIGRVRRAVVNRHQDHRFLHFKDADSWLKYNAKFGEGTPFSAVSNHLDRMARDIAAMETFGPNPERTLAYLVDYVKRQSHDRTAGEDARTMYKDLMGELDGVPNPKAAEIMRGARNIMVATKLPLATLSAISDTFFMGRTALFNDIPMVKVYKRFFRGLTGLEDRKLAGQMGLTLEYALDKVAAFQRVSTTTGGNWTARWADFALRANGLNHWTVAAEQAFGLEFLAHIARKIDTPFEELGKMKSALRHYGIGEKEWGVIRNTPVEEYKGMTYFNPTKLTDLDVMAKVQGMVLGETRMAAPRPTARVRSFMHGGQAAGTLSGEIRRSIFQFKGFPISIMMNHWARETSMGGPLAKMGRLGSMVIGTTILGAFAYNLKEIAKGRTPQDWDSGAFWVNGFIQGGGGALIGDALFMDPTKHGGVAQFLAGPLVGEADKLVKNFLVTPVKDLATEQDKFIQHVADKAVRTGEDYLPTPFNLPVVKTAIQRAVFDQLHKAANPNWLTNRRRMDRELRERGQSYWWTPGRTTPGR